MRSRSLPRRTRIPCVVISIVQGPACRLPLTGVAFAGIFARTPAALPRSSECWRAQSGKAESAHGASPPSGADDLTASFDCAREALGVPVAGAETRRLGGDILRSVTAKTKAATSTVAAAKKRHIGGCDFRRRRSPRSCARARLWRRRRRSRHRTRRRLWHRCPSGRRRC